mgnify:CR=1 FL=1
MLNKINLKIKLLAFFNWSVQSLNVVYNDQYIQLSCKNYTFTSRR